MRRESTYIVELEPGVYLLDVDTGDPGRTLVKSSAAGFIGASSATHALARAREYRPFIYATIEKDEY